jgi:hypothetical protein
MSTVRDLIDRAYRRIGEIGFGQALTPERADHGLNCLNDMCSGWAADGVDIGFTDVALNSAFFLPEQYFGGVAALLALRMSEDFGNTISTMPNLIKDAKNAWKQLLAAAIVAPTDTFIDPALQDMPSQRRYGDVSMTGYAWEGPFGAFGSGVVTTVAALASAATAQPGARAFVTDSTLEYTSTNIGLPVVGGGIYGTPVIVVNSVWVISG